MTTQEAQNIIQNYYKLKTPNAKKQQGYVNALLFLIEKDKDEDAMMALGGYYYTKGQFEDAAAYYEMAGAAGHVKGYEYLAFMYYNGKMGAPDYDKAVAYYENAMEMGNMTAAYKLADMYRDGDHVEQDYEQYRQLIEAAYAQIQQPEFLDDPYPEIFTRYARIHKADGDRDEAVRAYISAEGFLAQRLMYQPSPANLAMMRELIEDVYTMMPINPDNLEFYDLFELLKKPVKVSFRMDTEKYLVESLEDGRVEFNGVVFESIADFFAQAVVDERRLTSMIEEMIAFRVVE